MTIQHSVLLRGFQGMAGKKLRRRKTPFNKNFIPHFLGKLRDEPSQGEE